jgi:hypothetical protein
MPLFQPTPPPQRGRKPKTTEDEYYAGEFTDAELNCEADIADYQRAVEEFFLEYRNQIDEQNRAASLIQSVIAPPREDAVRP